MADESYTLSDAANVLGVSVPTLRRMVAQKRISAFRTPGGHLRITAESLSRYKSGTNSPTSRKPSPVLTNRRERIEELTLEAQEYRAKRELEKLRREEQVEAERREAEAESREQAAAQRETELEIERERLRHDGMKEAEKREAERELTDFRRRWSDEASTALAAPEYSWLSPGQRNEILEAVEDEIEKRHPADDPRMAAILTSILKLLVEPFQRQHEAQEKRYRAAQYALKNLPYSATEAERVRVIATIRDALRHLDDDADECEMRVAAQEAIQTLCQTIETSVLHKSDPVVLS